MTSVCGWCWMAFALIGPLHFALNLCRGAEPANAIIRRYRNIFGDYLYRSTKGQTGGVEREQMLPESVGWL